MFAVLMLVVLTGIYFFVNHNRTNIFFEKLDDRAVTVAQFYLAEDNLSKENFRNVLKKFQQSLPDEKIRIYDDQLRPKFVPEDTVRWDTNILKDVIRQKEVHLQFGVKQAAGIYYADNSGNFIIMVSAIDHNGFHDMEVLRLIMFVFFLVSLGDNFDSRYSFLWYRPAPYRYHYQQFKAYPFLKPQLKAACYREAAR